jgi:hypothetical protein
MPFNVTCPFCNFAGALPRTASGHGLCCPKCHKAFNVSAGGEQAPVYSPEPVEEEEPPPPVAVRRESRHAEDDDAEAHDPPARRRGSGGPSRGVGHQLLFAFRALAWFACLCVAVFVLTTYPSSLRRANGAIDEASIAADACVWLIGAYVIARVIDKATRW